MYKIFNINFKKRKRRHLKIFIKENLNLVFHKNSSKLIILFNLLVIYTLTIDASLFFVFCIIFLMIVKSNIAATYISEATIIFRAALLPTHVKRGLRANFLGDKIANMKRRNIKAAMCSEHISEPKMRTESVLERRELCISLWIIKNHYSEYIRE